MLALQNAPANLAVRSNHLKMTLDFLVLFYQEKRTEKTTKKGYLLLFPVSKKYRKKDTALRKLANESLHLELRNKTLEILRILTSILISTKKNMNQ